MHYLTASPPPPGYATVKHCFREEPRGKRSSIVNPISEKIEARQMEPKAGGSWLAKLQQGYSVDTKDPNYKTMAQVKSGGPWRSQREGGGEGRRGGWGSAPNPGYVAGAPPPNLRCPDRSGGSLPDPLLNGVCGGAQTGSGSRPGGWGEAPTPCVHESIKPTGLVRREEPNLSESSLAGGL